MAHLKEMQPGGFFDITTIKGNLRGIILGVICFLGMWYTHEIVSWVYDIFEIEREYSSVSKVKFRRVMSVFLGGGLY